MTTFIDSFERANGAPGGNWVSTINNATINGGMLISGNNLAMCYNTTISTSGRLQSTVRIFEPTNGSAEGGPAVKCDGSSACFFACLQVSVGVWYVCIYFGSGATRTQLVNAALPGFVGNYHKLSLVWDAAVLTAFVDDVEKVSFSDGRLASSPYAGVHMYYGDTPINDILIVGGSLPLLSIDPTVIPNYGTCSTVTLTGTGTSWTPGTPGSPSFTVDHGSISSQTVTDSTHATLTYCPGTWLGTVTFTDPSTGQTVGALVTSDPMISPPGGSSDTWSPYSTLVQHTGTYNDPNTIMTDQTTIIAAGAVDGLIGTWPDWDSGSPWPPTKIGMVQAIANIYAAVVNQQAVAPVAGTSLSPLLWRIDELRTWLYGGQLPTFGTQIGQSQSTIKQDLASIQGAGGVSLATLAAAMVGLSRTTDLQDLMDALDSIQGAGGVSLATLAAALSDLRGVGGASLADVLSAISDVSPDLSPILSAISALRGDSSSTVREAQIKATAAQTETASISLAVAALATTDHLTLGDLLAAIDAVPGGTGTATAGPPVWPGASKVTKLTSHALADDLVIAGPLHGVIVTITGSPSGAGYYDFGATRSWQHVGAVSFGDDDGHFERPDSLGLVSQVICPRTLAVASSATFRVNAGWTGTARGWTINP